MVKCSKQRKEFDVSVLSQLDIQCWTTKKQFLVIVIMTPKRCFPTTRPTTHRNFYYAGKKAPKLWSQYSKMFQVLGICERYTQLRSNRLNAQEEQTEKKAPASYLVQPIHKFTKTSKERNKKAVSQHMLPPDLDTRTLWWKSLTLCSIPRQNHNLSLPFSFFIYFSFFISFSFSISFFSPMVPSPLESQWLLPS